MIGHPSIDHVIVGTRRMDHLQLVMDAANS
jgi:hypothetical protein